VFDPPFEQVEVHPKQLSPTLKQRLSGTPTKSPEELSKDIEASAARSAKLRAVHLEAVRDRAARDIQRAQEAQARKLRVAAARTDRLLRKMDAASSKVEAKKEADEAERASRKAWRAALALAVADARKAAGDALQSRGRELLAQEHAASTKHARAVSALAAKGKSAVEHARAVVQARKDKEEQETAARAAALASRMHAAEARRLESLESPPRTPERAPPLSRVLNEGKVRSEQRRLAFDASMTKHAEARATHLAGIVSKCSAVTTRAADVAAKAKAAEAGTDAATTAAKSALFERLCAAEVARLSALKAKYAKLAKHADAHADVIVVRMDDVLSPRARPPAALLVRLAAKPSALVATAGTRQAAAAARRTLRAHARSVAFANAAARRVAAAERVDKALAVKTARVDVATARALTARAIMQGVRAHAVEKAAARAASAQLKRRQFAQATVIVGGMHDAKAAAALERATALRKPQGRLAARQAAVRTARAALDQSCLERGTAAAARCEAAANKRSAVMEARVSKARKLGASKSSAA